MAEVAIGQPGRLRILHPSGPGQKHKGLFDYRYVIMSAPAAYLLSHGGVVFTMIGIALAVLYDLVVHRTFRTSPSQAAHHRLARRVGPARPLADD